MRTFKIYFSALLAAFMLLLSACSGGISPIKGEKSDLNIVAKVYGHTVYLEEVRYLAKNYASDMKAKHGDGIFEGKDAEKYKAELTKAVEQAIKVNPTFLEVCEEYGIDIDSKSTKASVKEYINSFAEQIGGKDSYISQLEANGMTDHLLRYMLSIEFSREALRQKLCADGVIDDSDEKARAAIEGDDFIRTLHVYIGNDEGDDIEANRQKAESVLAQLDSGEPFNRMIGRHSEDVYMTTTDGYYFTRGEYEKAYEEAAFALEIDKYSGVIEGENGFYIILRLEKDADYIEANFENLKDRYLYVLFENILNDRLAEAVIEYTEFGKTLDLVTLAG